MLTFQQVLSGFVEYSKTKASYRTYCRLWDQYFLTWTAHPTFAEIEAWHRGLIATPHHANKALSLLKAMYTWALRRGHAEHNPASGVKRHPTHSRERVLTSQEVTLLLNTLDMMPKKISAMLLVLLTTGCRLSEARQMQRGHVDLVSGAWYQPHTKNGKPHTTYLPAQARHLLAMVPHHGDYLFGGVYDHCWSRAGVEKTWRQVRSALGLHDVRLHDFRRTLSTHLYRHTKDEYLVKRCINHVNPSVTAIYVRITQEEVATALQAQADRFYALVTPITPQFTRRSTDAQEVCHA